MKQLANVAHILAKLVLVASLFRITGVVHAQAELFRGLTYSPLGAATLNLIGNPDTGTLSVEGIGASGLDGVAVALPDVCFYGSQWDVIAGANNGDLLRFRIRGRLDELPDQQLGVVQLEKTGPELSLAVDLIPGGVHLNQLLVKNGYTFVSSDVIPDTGTVAMVGAWPDEMSLESACTDAIANWLSLAWDSPTTISVDGRPPVIADAVMIRSGEFRWDFSAVYLEAAGISPIVILDAQFGHPQTTAANYPASAVLTLSSSIPNPFNPRTEINFSLLRPATIRLSVHDAQGRLVNTLLHAQRDAGAHSVIWDGTDAGGIHVGSGVYLVSLMSGTEVRHQKVTLLR